jgi:hypothetical protein
MRKTIVVLAVGSVLATGAFHLSAQGPSDEWKARNGVGDRYEGIGIDPEVSAGFHLISFMHVSDPDPRSAINVSGDDEIVVDFYSRLASPYTLTVSELNKSKSYWMEPKQRQTAVLGQNTFKGIWKTDLLRKLNSNPRTTVPVAGLGVLVWFNKSDDDVDHVAPAVMRGSNAKPPQTMSAYRATFLPDMIIDDVSFSVRGGCQVSGASRVLSEGGSVGKQWPGSSFYVDIEVKDFPSGYAGQVMLELITPRVDGPKSPKDDNDKFRKTRYCFMHQPIPR